MATFVFMESNNVSLIKKKEILDKIIRIIFLIITAACALSVIFIAIFISVKGIAPFFKKYNVDGKRLNVNFFKFITGNTWFKKPNIYGAGYIILNTILVTVLALLISVPISVLTALFIVRIANKKVGSILNTIVELLSGIPSVIYGLFGAGIITIFVSKIARIFQIQTAGGLSLLSTALVLSMMILPTITMISVTAIKSVNNSLILGSLALGASKTETNFKVVLSAAKGGIFSGIILGVGRALGEATAVSMVCGNAGSGPTFNLFKTTRTLTSTMLQGIHETEGMDYDVRFSIGLLLIILIILTNVILNFIKNRIGNIGEKK